MDNLRCIFFQFFDKWEIQAVHAVFFVTVLMYLFTVLGFARQQLHVARVKVAPNQDSPQGRGPAGVAAP